MRYSFIILVALFCAACNSNVTQPSAHFDSMFFKRLGGGDLAFTVSPSPGVNGYRVKVTHREFRDTTVTLGLTRDSANFDAFTALASALEGRIQLKGSFVQSSLPTGTWAYVYMVKGTTQVEVTNTDLRDKLLVFEQLVRAKL